VDLQTFAAISHDYSHNNTILFTGNMDYAPNVDAVGYFAETIFPFIRSKVPGVKFIIAGQRPIKKVLDLAADDIVITGFVKDLAAMYNSASVVVAPLRFGAGTQNKVLEAMAMGVPVVCSNIGFKGLGIQSGQGAIMQTDPVAFANSVVELLSSETMRRTVGQEGVRVIRENFDWDIIAKMLEGYLAQVAARKVTV
jgi:glycosyltransferase involved in cell wall biosynthesis